MRRGLVFSGLLVATGLTLVAHGQEAAPDDALALALHARTTAASARAEQAAWFSLTVPLERVASPRPSLSRPAVAQAPPANDSEKPLPEASSAETAPEPSLDLAKLGALTDFSRRAVAVALAVAGAPDARRRFDGLASRSRWSATLPELRLRAQRNTDQALRWAPTSDDPYRVTQADGAGTILEASATFRLDRLLFSGDELAIERLRQQAGSEHLKLEQRLLQALLGLFRARERACAPSGNDDAVRLEQRLRIAELAVELDVLTAGWFLRRAPDLSRAVWGFPEALLGACQPPAPAPALEQTKAVASLDDSE
jgi:hypothetical protein